MQKIVFLSKKCCPCIFFRNETDLVGITHHRGRMCNQSGSLGDAKGEKPMSKFINLFTDFGFKKVFGQEENKKLLIGFLNALFEGEFVIRDLTYRDKEQTAETKKGRCVIYDIFCTLDDGKHIIL